MKNVLVFGASGYVGQNFCKLYGDKYNIDTSLGSSDKFNFFIPDWDKLGEVNDPLHAVLFLQGLNPRTGFQTIDNDDFDEMIQLNLSVPTMILSKLEEDGLIDDASIVFISSIAAKKGSYDPSYACAKAAMRGLIPTLMNNLSSRVNSISLGLVAGSPVHRGMTPGFEKNHRDRMGGKLVNVYDVCKTIDFLIECNSISGAEISLDCGYRL